MTYRIVPCPKCDHLHGVVAVRTAHSKAGAPAPARARRRLVSLTVGGTSVESPRTGVDVLAVQVPPLDDPASTSVQAASSRPSVFRGSTG